MHCTYIGRILSLINKYSYTYSRVYIYIYMHSRLLLYWHFLLCLIIHFSISLVPSATLAKVILITPLTRWDTVNRNVTNACYIIYWIIVEYQCRKLFEIITNWYFSRRKSIGSIKIHIKKYIWNFLAIFWVLIITICNSHRERKFPIHAVSSAILTNISFLR